MGRFNNSNFADRITSAATAKQALVEKLKSKPAPDDPEVEAERQAQLEVEKAAAESARLERAARILADEAERKAVRDARYAARKARVKG